MRKTPTSIITKIFVIVSLILLIGAITFFLRPKKSENKDSELITQVLPELLLQLQSRWEQGDQENLYVQRKLTCPDLIFNSDLVDSEFLKCNPNYLECFLQGKAGSATDIIHKIKDKKYQIEFLKQENKFVKVTPEDSVQLKIRVPGLVTHTMLVEFENTCRDSYLPQRIYSAGIKGEERYTWDNFATHIYVDRFYVSNQDVYFWLQTHPEIQQLFNIPIGKDSRYWFFPSTNLSLKQRHLYCQSYGKQLLQSHVLDAASFIPPNQNDSRPKFIYKHPYPWTKKSRSEFLSIAKANSDYVLTKNDCAKANIKGCDKLAPYKFYATNTATWMGIYFPLGHYMEVVDNKFDSFQNLKASSFYFGPDSIWHEIGMRAHWDGEGMELGHFSFVTSRDDKENYPPIGSDKLQVAFRCMRYREDI